jgi:ATP-dependent DNA helicase RecG
LSVSPDDWMILAHMLASRVQSGRPVIRIIRLVEIDAEDGKFGLSARPRSRKWMRDVNLDQLQRLVVEGESERIEFKKSTGDLKGGMETLCGFLNGRGGAVLFGVSTKRISGQTISDDTLRDVARDIAKLDPPATITQSRVRVSETHEVLVLKTTVRSACPYTYNGRPFRRVGSTTSLMPQQEYELRLLERGHSRQRWENQVAEDYRLGDLDRKEIQRTVREALNANRLEASVESPKEVLAKLHLITNQGVLQAAVVAFAKDVLPDFPQCGLRMARFRGTRKDEFIDQRQVHGNAFVLLEEAMLFLRRHLPVAGRFEPGVLTRLDEPLFPTLALREAVVNAICHRDYSIAGGAISIAIFDDRLDIASTGTLPFGLTVEDLKKEHTSHPRNPLLAEVFYRRGLIERWGRGTQKIVSLCVEAGHPQPEFEERAGEVVVRFIPSGYIPPHRISHNLTERQRRILHALRDGDRHGFAEIQRIVDPMLAKSTLRDDLILLRNLHLIHSGGHARGAFWQLEQRIPRAPLKRRKLRRSTAKHG